MELLAKLRGEDPFHMSPLEVSPSLGSLKLQLGHAEQSLIYTLPPGHIHGNSQEPGQSLQLGEITQKCSLDGNSALAHARRFITHAGLHPNRRMHRIPRRLTRVSVFSVSVSISGSKAYLCTPCSTLYSNIHKDKDWRCPECGCC